MNKKVVLLKDLCVEGEWGKYGIPASAEEYDATKKRYLRITDITDDGELLNSGKKSVSSPSIENY
ncbi:MAG: restriction endonuclease subunit S, partial [Candidatus Paceibacterota bacterium]